MKSNNKNVWVFTFIIVILCIALLSGVFAVLRVNLYPFTSSFTDNFFNFRNNFGTKISSIFSMSKIKKENDAFKDEIALLNAKLSNYSNLEDENLLLKEQLNISLKNSENILLATVINRNSNIYSDKDILNMGSDQGVSVGNLVIYKNILVGKISSVEKSYSELERIDDIKAIYPVTVLGDKKYKGVMRGVLGQDKLKVTNVEKTSITPIDSYVVLSKEDYIYHFTDEILIGQVSNMVNSDNDVYKELEITPMLNLSSLDKVFILL